MCNGTNVRLYFTAASQRGGWASGVMDRRILPSSMDPGNRGGNFAEQ